jgi:hypothetical protein
MPVLFTLDLPTDETEAERWATVVRGVRCDVHDVPPTEVRLTYRSPRPPSLFTTGCCPQLYIVVTERIAQEASRSHDGTERGAAGVLTPRPRRLPTVV